MTVQEITEHFEYLKNLLSREFIYPEEICNSESAVRTALSYYQTKGILSIEADAVTLHEDASGDLVFFARAVQDMLEPYFIVMDVVNQNHKKRMISKDLTVEVRKNGIKLFHLGKVKLAESLSAPSYKNAIQKLKDDSILTEEALSKKNSVFNTKDQVTPRKIRDTIEQYLSLLA
jgi:glycerol-3-phosphate O-acyltransferase